MSNIAPFESPKELINGAKESIGQLKALCKPLGESNEYKIVTEFDANAGEHVVYIRLMQKLAPKIMRLASSIIKELRMSLDQAFCDAALLLGRKNAVGINFPFGKDLDDLNNEIKSRCKKVDQLLIDYCVRFKPYFGGDSDGVLWSMSRLAGTYHRRIIALRYQEVPEFGFAIIKASGLRQLTINKWDDANNQFEVARFDPDGKLEIRDNFVFPLEVIFSETAHAVAGRPVLGTLDHFIGITEHIIFGIEAKTALILHERKI